MPLTELDVALVAYEQDFFLWTQQQAGLLRQRNEPGVDWENLAEEIESLGGRDRRELESRLEGLLLHLLKWRYQPEERKGGWQSSIRFQRSGIRRIFEQSPSLRRRPPEILASVYAEARLGAFEEMRLVALSQIPEQCPFTIDEVLDPEWLPDRRPAREMDA